MDGFRWGLAYCRLLEVNGIEGWGEEKVRMMRGGCHGNEGTKRGRADHKEHHRQHIPTDACHVDSEPRVWVRAGKAGRYRPYFAAITVCSPVLFAVRE